MSLHLIKLCVGVDRLEQLQDWQRRRAAAAARDPAHPPLSHVTRMTPRRREEVLAGGSLFWVIKGVIQVRQRILDLNSFDDEDGISRCRIVLDDALVPTVHQPKRPFQGWRYLKPEDAPKDLKDGGMGGEDLPSEMRAELSELGLL
ncbi:MAG: DUF1489 family protein [Alphaproteobacteria bacterium]|nr:MAG: DUF1489 family protein [Alphaproteobacteria bacterium]